MFGLRNHLTIWFSILLLMVGGVISAEAMAPKRGVLFEAEIAALGLTASDICGGDFAHTHKCPFCDRVAETHVPAPVDFTQRRFAIANWFQPSSPLGAGQPANRGNLARAPPLSV